MSVSEALGFLMLLGMIGVIFIGFPISFTLLFLALVVRRIRTGLGADLQSRLSPDLGHDEGRDLSRRAALHLHGLHDRAGRAHGAAVRGAPEPARPGARLALSGGHPDRDHLRHGHRHRRRGGDGARHHGRPDDAQVRLRRSPVGRRDRRRRHAWHPDSAQHHAGRDGPGHGRARQSALLGGVRPRVLARRLLRRLHAPPQLHQPEAGARHDHGGAQGRLRRHDDGEGRRSRGGAGSRLPDRDGLSRRRTRPWAGWACRRSRSPSARSRCRASPWCPRWQRRIPISAAPTSAPSCWASRR